MDVSDWLQELGLERYEPLFRDNEIDWEVLPELTESDLEKLGLPLGPRKKLLKAIAALPASTTERVTPYPAVAVSSAERRQLTVMFVDLIDSTKLSQRLDPEDMSEVIRAYHGRTSEVIRRWGGHVAKYLGDGVLAYFGWPQAHEDDAERAVRAGLGLTRAVADIDDGAGAKLAVRIGIATGPVVVGELIGEGVAQEQAVVGETPNLAARLQAAAPASGVVISAATRRLLGGLFALSDLGPVRLTGFSQPLAAFRIEGEGHAEGRFEALHGERLTPLVGREHELGILLDRFERAREGDGQVVLLAGEAGIGKSRIVRALRERLGDRAYMPLSHYCSPHHTSSPLYPVVGLLERAAGFEREDPATTRLAKLRALLALASEDLGEALPLIGALLEIPLGEEYPALDLTPQRQKQRTLEVLVDQVAGLAAKQPVLALYEDVHWIDPTTLETVSLLIERVPDLRVLVLITCRPEFSSPWRAHAHLMQLSLTRLSRSHDAALVQRITGGKVLPPEVLDQIVTKTDGVPLFVEELTKAVLEAGFLRDIGGRYESIGPRPTFAIPSSLHDSLMARLDRLGSAKEVAQTGALIGREFPYELLAAVDERPSHVLDDALDRLVRSGLVFRRGSPPDSTYNFKHALVQDAAYQSFLRSKRRHFHAKIAEVLKTKFTETVELQPERIAHHYTEAGLAEQAIGYWRRAAERAVQKSANLEGVGHYNTALALLATLPPGTQRDRNELDLQLGLGAALIPPKSYASEEVRDAFARAAGLCRETSDTASLFRALRGLWNWHLLRANLQEAVALAGQLARLAEQSDEPARKLMAHRITGTTSLGFGSYAAARDEYAKGIDLYDPNEQKSYVLLYGEDPGLICSVYLAEADDYMGRRDNATRVLNSALEAATNLPHQYSRTFVLALCAFVALCRREPEATRRYAEKAITIAREQGVSQWLAYANVYSGWALAAQGNVQKGLEQVREGLEAWRALGCLFVQPNHLTVLADVYRMLGEHERGLRCLERADTIVRNTGYGIWTTELYRLRGDLLINLSRTAEAEQEFGKALKLARVQCAKTFELAAATSLARLWAERGEREKANDLLAPVYGWFTEGFDTADLKDAKALLDELQ